MNRHVAPEVVEADVELGELNASLGFLLRVAQLQIFEQFFEAMSGESLKPGEFTVLWVIGLNPGAGQGAIARRLMIKPAHMTKLIQRLVEAGHVERTVPPDDRRSVQLSLTKEGLAFVAKHKDRFLQLHEAERGSFTDTEYTRFVALLRKLIVTGSER